MIKKFLFILMFLPTLAFADMSTGEKLVYRLWKDMKEGHIKKIKEYTSKNFQSLDEAGRYNRCQELQRIKNMSINTYTLTDMTVTKGENIIVVTYIASVATQPEGPESQTQRLEVWKKIDGEWKWVACVTFILPVPVL